MKNTFTNTQAKRCAQVAIDHMDECRFIMDHYGLTIESRVGFDYNYQKSRKLWRWAIKMEQAQSLFIKASIATTKTENHDLRTRGRELESKIKGELSAHL